MSHIAVVIVNSTFTCVSLFCQVQILYPRPNSLLHQPPPSLGMIKLVISIAAWKQLETCVRAGDATSTGQVGLVLRPRTPLITWTRLTAPLYHPARPRHWPSSTCHLVNTISRSLLSPPAAACPARSEGIHSKTSVRLLYLTVWDRGVLLRILTLRPLVDQCSMHLSLWRSLFPYGYSSCARPG